MVRGSVLSSLIFMQLSNFPTPLAEEPVFSPLYVLASFAKINRLYVSVYAIFVPKQEMLLS